MSERSTVRTSLTNSPARMTKARPLIVADYRRIATGSRGSSKAVLRKLLVQAFAGDAQRLGRLGLVAAVLAQRLGQKPALDLFHLILERALFRRDAAHQRLDLANLRRQIFRPHPGAVVDLN